MNPAVNAVMYPNSKNANSFADGMEFQDFVVEQFNAWGLYIQLHSSKRYQFERGESVQRVEIKLDNRCTETGRLSIEVGERTSINGPWVSSAYTATIIHVCTFRAIERSSICLIGWSFPITSN